MPRKSFVASLCDNPLAGVLSICTITSPPWIPARAAGDVSIGAKTTSPVGLLGNSIPIPVAGIPDCNSFNSSASIKSDRCRGSTIPRTHALTRSSSEMDDPECCRASENTRLYSSTSDCVPAGVAENSAIGTSGAIRWSACRHPSASSRESMASTYSCSIRTAGSIISLDSVKYAPKRACRDESGCDAVDGWGWPPASGVRGISRDADGTAIPDAGAGVRCTGGEPQAHKLATKTGTRARRWDCGYLFKYLFRLRDVCRTSVESIGPVLRSTIIHPHMSLIAYRLTPYPCSAHRGQR